MLVAFLLMPTAAAADLPEFPFCPLGGPTGWFNRLFDDDDHHYPPPAFWAYPVPAYPVTGPYPGYPVSPYTINPPPHYLYPRW